METTNLKNQKTTRIPIVSIMGHIDHGKSTLLEYIKKTKITDHEAGGITQQIGAYEVEIDHDGQKRKITFIDTPGHEAFSSMRNESSRASDIAILVVSAEEGFKAQTKEALECAKNHNLPIIVAITKIDKAGADLERTKINLAENHVFLEGYGGNTSFVPVSGKTGAGIDELLELIILTAEIYEISGDKKKMADGFVIESDTDKKRGVASTLIIKNGKLKSGDFVVSGKAFAPVRIMENFKGQIIKEAEMGSPVRIFGWNTMPAPGQIFVSVKTKKEVEEKINQFKLDEDKIQKETKNEILDSETVFLNLILKADTSGSLNAIQKEVSKVFVPKVKIRIVNQGIGDITEKDAKLAISTNPHSLIGAFNIGIDRQAGIIIERENLQTEVFDIIYKISDWLKEKALAIKPKIIVEEKNGEAKILKIFSKLRDKQIVGGKVIEGKINLGGEVKIIRRGEEIGRGKIRELQSQKLKTSEVTKGIEFGAMIDSKTTLVGDDKIETFITKEE